MAPRKRWFKKKEPSLKGTGYDSYLEKNLHEGKLAECDFHPSEKISYVVPHTYEPDFKYEKGNMVYLIEAKGRFQDAATARKYTFIKEHLPENHELVFVWEKASTKFPHARKRKDGTYMTNEEWSDKYGFRHWEQNMFQLENL